MRSHDGTTRLAHSWDANADAWTRAVRSGSIESRRAATDLAIVDAVLARSPQRVLDVGCGEGWLARALSDRGVAVVGMDGSASLIEAAQSTGGGEFHHVRFDELAADPTRVGAPGFDVAVCNFSLLDENLHGLLRSLYAVLSMGGALVIQTVHPWTAAGDEGYVSAWRTETFSALAETFAVPMPWYFRTLESWIALLRGAGFRMTDIREPMHPRTRQPLSLILVLQPDEEHER